MGNVPHRLGYLNTRFPLGGAVWEVMGPLRGAALLEEVDQWGRALRVSILGLLPVCSVCFLIVTKDVISQLPVPAACCHASHHCELSFQNLELK